MEFELIIKPAVLPEIRHKIEAVLEKEGFDVIGGGTHGDMSRCDISFETKDELTDG